MRGAALLRAVEAAARSTSPRRLLGVFAASLRLLWHATLLAGTTLIALLLLVPKKTGAVTELPADPAFTLREDNGVTKVCPVHTGRAKKDDEPPILEGTSRALDNYANPRGLSFLPPRPELRAEASVSLPSRSEVGVDVVSERVLSFGVVGRPKEGR